ncbi:MAG TPA: tetratricopeptide repeat protein [Bryobacteraceae bacterium]|nr:tetratricopeptide repeat protein [Bryobacteraceae bacterium]
MKAPVLPSPYPGPRPFQPGEEGLFFGRESETREMVSLVTAHRIMILYARSGAGKTSLLNVGVAPALRNNGFQVLPIASVRGGVPGGLPPDKIANVYVFRILMNWVNNESARESCGANTLADHLRSLPHPLAPDGLPAARVAIFDQFEEIFTLHLERWQDRHGLFAQLQAALDEDPLLRIVLALREDYLAQLEPYGKILSLRKRLRLEQLDADAALAAITGPLAGTSRVFAAGVAEKLVENLLLMRVETENGQIVEVPGEFIEPVQLQVCCDTLWCRLPAEATVITEEHVRQAGDIDRALSAFYDDAIHAASEKTSVPEESLRNWCQDTLITAMGTRGTVYREQENTGGIPNACVDELESRHLIRAEYRAGAHWYELSHDRFIEPIRASNRAFQDRRMLQVNEAIQETNKIIDQAQQAWQEGRQADSLSLIEKAYAVYRTVDEVAALGYLADNYRSAEQYQKAVDTLSKAIALRPDLPRLYEARGGAYWYDGRFSEAIEDFTHVLEADPDNADAHSSRGQALAESGQYEFALTDLNRAIELAYEQDRASISAYSHSGRGLAHGGLGAYEEAFRDFSESISQAPDNAWVYFNRAVVYERMGQTDKARADYETALNKRTPPLNRWKREQAAARLRETSGLTIQ